MVDLLERINAAGERMSREREKHGFSREEEAHESRVQSVYASLAIEDPTVTEEEVRAVLSERYSR